MAKAKADKPVNNGVNVEALFGAPHEHLAVRVALVAGTGSPLDLGSAESDDR